MSDFLKPGIVIDTVAQMTRRSALLPNLFLCAVGGSGSESPRQNDSVRMDVPRTGSLPDRSVDVLLTNHSYSALQVTDEDQELPTLDFVNKIVAAQSRALSAGTEQTIAKWLDRQLIPSVWVGQSGVRKAVETAHSILDGYGVGTGRVTVLGSALTNLLRPFTPGVDDTRLTETQIPSEVLGGEGYESWEIDRTSGYVFHPTAFALHREAPSLPARGSGSIRLSARSRGYRWITDWDNTLMSDRSLFDTFIGLELIKDDGLVKRVVKVQL